MIDSPSPYVTKRENLHQHRVGPSGLYRKRKIPETLHPLDEHGGWEEWVPLVCLLRYKPRIPTYGKLGLFELNNIMYSHIKWLWMLYLSSKVITTHEDKVPVEAFYNHFVQSSQVPIFSFFFCITNHFNEIGTYDLVWFFTF